ncbi:hypothetical protein AVEN_80052-1 [Araneus ventricosus]|uniref:Uncharacterized protein n=1 Tax=Araneus ventricosus TaxID=182803 RepID=A0A4Y2ENP6_ARAVE|nr:hypothetical protein AVEN_80052-1 [Araneus ventricosus]
MDTFPLAGASEKSPNNVEFHQISYNHSLGDFARVWFTIGDICAPLTPNRFAWRLGSRLVYNWRHLRPANGKVPKDDMYDGQPLIIGADITSPVFSL